MYGSLERRSPKHSFSLSLSPSPLNSYVNEAFLQYQCIVTLDKCGGSRFTHLYYTCCTWLHNHILCETGNCTHQYMLKPIPLFAIWTIASMRLSSHALRCEPGRWGTSDESGRLCTLCPKQVWESEYHTLIQCSAFDHIRLCFPHLFDWVQSLHEFISQPQCALSIATFISKFLEHRESLLTFTRITWNVIFLVS